MNGEDEARATRYCKLICEVGKGGSCILCAHSVTRDGAWACAQAQARTLGMHRACFACRIWERCKNVLPWLEAEEEQRKGEKTRAARERRLWRVKKKYWISTL